MAFARINELFSISCEGAAYPNVVKEVKVPDFKRKYEAFKAGGMDTPIHVDLGGEAMEAELTIAGLTPDQIVKDFMAKKHMGKTWSYRGYYRDQETGQGYGVEIVMRGRHNIDNPSAKPGEAGEAKVKVHLSYYKLVIEGRTLIEIEPTAAKHFVDGEDKLADARNFLGL